MIAGSEQDMEGRRYFREPRFVRDQVLSAQAARGREVYKADVWVLFDESGWCRGTASTSEAAARLFSDAVEHKVATPILDPPHYE